MTASQTAQSWHIGEHCKLPLIDFHESSMRTNLTLIAFGGLLRIYHVFKHPITTRAKSHGGSEHKATRLQHLLSCFRAVSPLRDR